MAAESINAPVDVLLPPAKATMTGEDKQQMVEKYRLTRPHNASVGPTQSFHTTDKPPLPLRRKLSLNFNHKKGYQPLQLTAEGNEKHKTRKNSDEHRLKPLSLRDERTQSLTSSGSSEMSDLSPSPATPSSPNSLNPPATKFIFEPEQLPKKLNAKAIQKILSSSNIEQSLRNIPVATLSKLTVKELNKKINGKSLLQIAWEQESFFAVIWLIQHGANASVVFKNNKTIKQLVAESQQYEHYRTLLLEPNVLISINDIHVLLMLDLDTQSSTDQNRLYQEICCKIKTQHTSPIDINEKLEGVTVSELALKRQNIYAFVHFITLGANIDEMIETHGGAKNVSRHYNIEGALEECICTGNTPLLFNQNLFHALLKLEVSASTVQHYLIRAQQAAPKHKINLNERLNGCNALEIVFRQGNYGAIAAVLISFGANPFIVIPINTTLYEFFKRSEAVDSFILAIDTSITHHVHIAHTLTELSSSKAAVEILKQLVSKQPEGNEFRIPVHGHNLLQRVWGQRRNAMAVIPLLLAAERSQHTTENQLDIKSEAYRKHEHALLHTLFTQSLLDVQISDLAFCIEQKWELDLFKKMLQACPQACNQAVEGKTLLERALENRDVALSIELMNAQSDVNNPATNDKTLFELSEARHITEELVLCILNHNSCELNLIHALLALHCSPDQLKQKIQQSSDAAKPQDLSCLRNENSAIQLAWKYQANISTIELLVLNNVDVNMEIEDQLHIKALLRQANRFDDLRRLLVIKSCQVELIDLHDIVNQNWENELFCSALDRFKSCKEATNLGEKIVHTKINGSTLLDLVCEHNNLQALQALFALRIPFTADFEGRTILHRAANKSSLPILEALVTYMTNDDELVIDPLQIQDSILLNSCVHYGMNNPNLEVIVFLISKTPPEFFLTTKNRFGQTPHSIAYANNKLFLSVVYLSQHVLLNNASHGHSVAPLSKLSTLKNAAERLADNKQHPQATLEELRAEVEALEQHSEPNLHELDTLLNISSQLQRLQAKKMRLLTQATAKTDQPTVEELQVMNNTLTQENTRLKNELDALKSKTEARS